MFHSALSRWPWVLALAASTAALSGCGLGARYTSDDPVSDIKNSDLQVNQRQIALDQLDEGMRNGTIDPKAGRESLKDLIWKTGAPSPLRQKALAILLSDQSPEMIADTRNLLRLRLPTETSWPLIDDICAAIRDRASDPAWQDQTAALVRSWARRVPTPTDAERPERSALAALHPSRTVEASIFEVFARPEDNGAPPRPDDYASKASSAAWELLGRLDPDGSKRGAILASRAGAEPALAPILKSARELGVVPVTASELSWLKRLMDDKDAFCLVWWNATSSAVAMLSPEQRTGLQLRHLEPLRWASANRSNWVASERAALLGELSSRLSGRRLHRLTGDLPSGEISREALRDWESTLVWGDLLTILVIDEALRSPAIASALAVQADADRADESTEYGGLLWAADQYPKTKTTEAFLVRGYQPRPAQRANDRTFVAPEVMFSEGARSLAHYHFHVQTDTNAEYAGPGKGDLEYAETHGRACLVFTTVRAGVMDVDYYQRSGVIIDLGEFTATPGANAR